MERVEGERGAYRLTQGLVEGGQGVVWAAIAPDGSRVAIKVARPGIVHPRTVAQEASAMRSLAEQVRGASRWLVPILDVGVGPSGEPFYVMPLFDGTLKDLMHAGVPLLARLHALAQACHAIELLHAASTADRVLVHRDVKPTNFLVRSDPHRLEVHLADFGGLREAALMTDSTQTTILTPHYAPPEQYFPLRVEPDPSMDVFALAAMVYEGLTCDGPPESAWNARLWHGPLGRELLRLAARRSTLDPEEAARFEELRNLPARRLLELTDRPRLEAAEVALLRNRLADALREEAAPSRLDSVVEEAVETLAPVLERALEPDPRLRTARATAVRQAVAGLHDLVAGVLGRTNWSIDPLQTFSRPDGRGVGAPALSPPSAPTMVRDGSRSAPTLELDDDPETRVVPSPATARFAAGAVALLCCFLSLVLGWALYAPTDVAEEVRSPTAAEAAPLAAPPGGAPAPLPPVVPVDEGSARAPAPVIEVPVPLVPAAAREAPRRVRRREPETPVASAPEPAVHAVAEAKAEARVIVEHVYPPAPEQPEAPSIAPAMVSIALPAGMRGRPDGSGTSSERVEVTLDGRERTITIYDRSGGEYARLVLALAEAGAVVRVRDGAGHQAHSVLAGSRSAWFRWDPGAIQPL